MTTTAAGEYCPSCGKAVRLGEGHLCPRVRVFYPGIPQLIDGATPRDRRIMVYTPLYGGQWRGAQWEPDKWATVPKPYWSLDGHHDLDESQRLHPPTHWMEWPAVPAIHARPVVPDGGRNVPRVMPSTSGDTP